MKRFAVVAAILGVTLLGVLVAYSGLGDVMAAVAAAGWATAIVVALRVAALAGAGMAWQWLFPPDSRPALWLAMLLRFIREAVNQLLPVAAVGGDVVGARLATFWRIDGAMAGAATIADVAIQAATQFLFALAGVALLVWLKGDSEIVRYAVGGLGLGALLIVAFFTVQAKLGSRLVHAFMRKIGHEGLGRDLVERLWAALAAVYADPARIAWSSALNLAIWVLGTLEVYVALHFMGYPITFAEAIVIESLGQAVRGAAFAVPGGLGVQEGGFVALCALFGVPPGPALALSLVKRVADVTLGLPFLAVWQVLEGRRVFLFAERRP